MMSVVARGPGEVFDADGLAIVAPTIAHGLKDGSGAFFGADQSLRQEFVGEKHHQFIGPGGDLKGRPKGIIEGFEDGAEDAGKGFPIWR